MNKDVVYMCVYTHTHAHTYTYNVILLCHKKHETLPFEKTRMNLEGIMLIEISQRQISYDFTQVWNIKPPPPPNK